MTNPGVVIEYGRARPRNGQTAAPTVQGDRTSVDITAGRSIAHFAGWEDGERSASIHEVPSLDDLGTTSRSPDGAPRTGDDAVDEADVRVYEQVGWEATKAGYSPGSAPILLIVGMTMQEGYFDELIRWYEEEHFPLLLKVDGWQRVRRFMRVEGRGPVHVTLCEIASIDVFDDPAKLAAATPWRNALAEKRTEYERVIYKRL